MVSEIFFRDRMVMSLGLQQLDMLLSRILNTLFHQASKLPKEQLHILLNYDLKSAMTSSWLNRKVDGSIIYLGNKGSTWPAQGLGPSHSAGLHHHHRGVPLLRNHRWLRPRRPELQGADGRPDFPAGRTYRETIQQPGKPAALLGAQRLLHIPAGHDGHLSQCGHQRGDRRRLAPRTRNAWFAWDSYRRFLQCYGMAFDLTRDDFDALMVARKERHGISYKRGFSGEQMRAVALDYQQSLIDAGIEIPLDPFDQLHMTINRVFASWHSSKARTYRRIMGISDDWGTAVTVQAMVFGNRSSRSGTGVFFTHNPRWSEDHLRLWGDFTPGNQGEDVVAGLVQTLPISLIQQEIEMRDTDVTLETHFPEIYRALEDWAHELVDDRGWTPQEIEFTFESPSVEDLHVLQTRDMTMRERKKVLAFDPKELSDGRLLGHGIGVSGGAMSGRVVFSLEEMDGWRRREPDTRLILVRGDTVPDDIREIYAADGLLTARGGLTSHAAVVAHRLGKTCVTGCVNMECYEKQRYFLFDRQRLESGDHISIDGTRGSVYQGLLTIKEA
jgi:pyruvate,orthophosphate dikinase